MKQSTKITALAVAILLTTLLWSSVVLFPLRILSVFFHESSHALVTLATEGEVREFSINSNEGGHVLSEGGNYLLTANAGYLGNLLIGCTVLLLTARTSLDKSLCWVLGLGIIAIAAYYIRSFWALGTSLAIGGAFILIAILAKEIWCKWILILVGLHSSLYAIGDITSDVLLRRSQRSDAWYLAQSTGIPVLVWGVGWASLSLVCLYFALRWSLKPEAGMWSVPPIK